MQKVKVKGHWVQKLEWKWTDRRRMDGGDCIRPTFRNTVSKHETVRHAVLSDA